MLLSFVIYGVQKSLGYDLILFKLKISKISKLSRNRSFVIEYKNEGTIISCKTKGNYLIMDNDSSFKGIVPSGNNPSRLSTASFSLLTQTIWERPWNRFSIAYVRY